MSSDIHLVCDGCGELKYACRCNSTDTTADARPVSRNTEEQLVRIRLDALIRQTWCALRDLSDYRNGKALTQEDLNLWGRITPHPAIQRVLDRDIANAFFTLRGEAKRNPDRGERSCST